MNKKNKVILSIIIIILASLIIVSIILVKNILKEKRDSNVNGNNNNEINVEQSSDNEIPNEEYIYSYDPKNGMKIDYENSGKKNLKHYFENYSIEYPLMFQNEINFSIDGTFNDKEKAKYDLKCNELNKKEEEFINLMNKYNLLIKKMN